MDFKKNFKIWQQLLILYWLKIYKNQAVIVKTSKTFKFEYIVDQQQFYQWQEVIDINNKT